MRILFDIVHPAHVHFFKHVIRSLEQHGHQTRIVARDKDVTTQLLDRLGFAYEAVGQARRKGALGQARELMHRNVALARVCRAFQPDLIVTRNPAGAQVGRALGIRAVFDTDDGRAAGAHFWSAAAFAHVITSPDCTGEDYGRRHVKYPGYKQTAYLHPDHFTPDPAVLDALRLERGERFFLVRFVEMVASHDWGERGLPLAIKSEIVSRLGRRGRVFVTHEGELGRDMAHLRFPLSPDRLHDALAFAELLVGDSQTMAAEAAVLGTPSLRVSSWTGRLPYLRELEHRYGLTFAYRPGQTEPLLQHLDRWLSEPDLRGRFSAARQRLLADKVDVAAWLTTFLEAGAPLGRVAYGVPQTSSAQ